MAEGTGRLETNSIHPLIAVLKELPEYNRLYELLAGAGGPVSAFGLPEAEKAHVFAALCKARGGIFITATEQGAERMYSQAAAFLPHAALLPARETPLVHAYAASGGGAKTRLSTLTRLSMGEPLALVASVEAAMQALAPPEVLRASGHTVRLGDSFSPRALLRALFDAGYDPAELVEEPGQAAHRGDILDVYPFNAAEPCRIEFFGDEADRLSRYDPGTQRSIENIKEIFLPPATEAPQDAQAIARALAATEGARGFDAQRAAHTEGRPAFGVESLLPVLYAHTATLFDYLKEDAFILVDEPPRVDDAAATAHRLFLEAVRAMLARGEGLAAQERLMVTPDALTRRLNTGRTALLFTLARSSPRLRPRETVQFDARPAPQYISGGAELARDVQTARQAGMAVLLYAGGHAQKVARDLLEGGCEAGRAASLTRAPVQGEALVLEESLPFGMLYPSLHLMVLTETELFGAARLSAAPRRTKSARTIFSDLEPGDYVVHEAHGIGRFMGVQALSVQDTTRDYLLMEYHGGDRLYIPTDQLDRVQKYVGGDDPKLSRLGGSEWQRQVSRAKSAVKELAFDLAQLYAAREHTAGFAFSKDTVWQAQLEDSFPYEETPDQLLSIQEVKRDMENSRVMDRLLLGDVGYGKTEVALRAAFKAVQDGKQAAFLVPTTILAQQHYNTLSLRFAGFPVRVALLSRFKTVQEQKAVKAALASGEADVVVGTHALLSKDVKFKDLGLLVIDEEQRFGVGHKELIKTLRQNVDVLTLSATPIPRTLHMSMIGIRDLSVIDTPPEDRFPVQTYVLEYSDTLLRDTLMKELGRGGQCYLVYNRVQRLERFADRLYALVPEARIAVAHGQMSERALEKVMLDYIAHRTDVLLCSTIIENGLDIQNANTLFVMDADKMGLAQLYQLRGRIGRSARMGYAYFTFRRDKALSEVALKRLTALTEFAQLGAGREIALRDLEIRGAGSLLGARQHGHIADIGYEYYAKLMAAAVKTARGGEEPPPAVDCTVDIPLDAHIPRAYISSETQRLAMYKRIAMITSAHSLMDVQEEMEDRYGDIPAATRNLMDVALVKALAARAQITTLTVSENGARLCFHPEAALDGAALLSAAAEYGAQLVPGDTVSLVYKRPHADAAEITKFLRPLLETLGRAAGVDV